MKKPTIIKIDKIMASLNRYKESPEFKAKIEDARKAYEKDRVWLEPLLNAKS
ncbi:MAG: hypothetical protein ACKVOU_10970 [Cytophagales bacterium]